jgi:hypothetical protein
MCARPMQCRLREYASFNAENSVHLVDGEGDNNGNALLRAWFPEGVVFDETAVSYNTSICFNTLEIFGNGGHHFVSQPHI